MSPPNPLPSSLLPSSSPPFPTPPSQCPPDPGALNPQCSMGFVVKAHLFSVDTLLAYPGEGKQLLSINNLFWDCFGSCSKSYNTLRSSVTSPMLLAQQSEIERINKDMKLYYETILQYAR